MKWNVLVLAGDRGPTDPVAQAAGVRTKAFADIAGRPMYEWVIEALREVDGLGDIAMSIAPDAPALPDDLIRLDAGPTPATSLAAGLQQMGAPLLVTTADNPLLTPDMVRDFLAGVGDADVAAAVSLKPVVEQAGNNARRTYLKFSDGWASGCNLFALTTPQAANAVEFWKDLEAHRKSPLTMARKVGLGALALFAMRMMSRERAARMIGARAGCSARIVTLNHPNAAHDVDKAADIAFANTKLSD
ncbi:MAG: NTP transferase domain-containing protein [Pikeienuella sp.]